MTLGSWPLWWQHAECASVAIEIFFQEDELSVQRCQALCRECRVLPSCRNEALAVSRLHIENDDANLDTGFFGGMSVEARQDYIYASMRTTTVEQKELV